eukprot:CAMPEP_0170630044 /NCGR_PEP_ID=MMETSP0224-20130122/33730_1 /TAXON_ID=285029 /ORGANISM="Togula jolla, Strain CCCM 725" /LENGTH=176 /DNA_ID=CAMNT_0010957955 /DNA_START=156 /DNA_END=686 /DNA_ORIENTATION=-
MALSITELYYCALTLLEPDLEQCSMPPGLGRMVGLTNWIYLQMAFACANLLFAPYFQSMVWQKLMLDVQPVGDMRIPAAKVQESFRHVFLHDLGVLFYFFALVASFIWSTLGSTWVNEGDFCNPRGYPGWSYWLGLSFFWIALLYSALWYCCDCCASSVSIQAPVVMAYVVPDDEQ